MSSTKYKLMLLCSLYYGMFAFSQNIERFNKATEDYNKGLYNEALKNYQQILNSEVHSADLYYNMANCYYKTNEVASSIYYYHKALKLRPNDIDILNNLNIAKQKTIDVIENTPQSFWDRIGRQMNFISYDNWAVSAVIFTILFSTSFLIYYFLEIIFRKKIFFILSMGWLFIATASLFFAYQIYRTETNTRYAIIFAEQAKVKSEPNVASDKLFDLHEGTQVRVLDALDSWTKISVSNGQVGWMLKSDIRLY